MSKKGVKQMSQRLNRGVREDGTKRTNQETAGLVKRFIRYYRPHKKLFFTTFQMVDITSLLLPSPMMRLVKVLAVEAKAMPGMMRII
jgi:hypothetical protein